MRNVNVVNSDWAIFTDNAFAITDRFTVTAGLRYSKAKKKGGYFAAIYSEAGFTTTQLLTLEEALGNTVAVTIDQPLNVPSDAISGRLVAMYKITEDTQVYASYSRGFREGGYNGAVFFPNELTIVSPEYNNAYEVGVKSDLFHSKLRVNFDLFYMKLSDQQIVSSKDAVVQLYNAANSVNKGAELEVTFAPTSSFTTQMRVTYMSARYKKFLSDDEDLSGNYQPQAPKWKLSGSMRYEHPIGNDKFIELAADASWRSAFYFNHRNAIESREKGYALLNGSLNLNLKDTGITIGLWAKNLTDTKYRTQWYSAGSLGFNPNVVSPPRTFGIRTTYRM